MASLPFPVIRVLYCTIRTTDARPLSRLQRSLQHLREPQAVLLGDVKVRDGANATCMPNSTRVNRRTHEKNGAAAAAADARTRNAVNKARVSAFPISSRGQGNISSAYA